MNLYEVTIRTVLPAPTVTSETQWSTGGGVQVSEEQVKADDYKVEDNGTLVFYAYRGGGTTVKKGTYAAGKWDCVRLLKKVA